MSYITFRPNGESTLLLSELAQRLDKHPHTVRRWAKEGIKGIQMRVCRMPAGIATTLREYDKFVDAISE